MIRRLAAAAAVSIALFALAPAAPAQAYSACNPYQYCGWYYYNSASVLVGEHMTLCGGDLIRWGAQSGPSLYYYGNCPGSPPPAPNPRL